MQVNDEVRATFLMALVTDLRDAGKLPATVGHTSDIALGLYRTLGGDDWLAGYSEYSPALIDALKVIYSWENAILPRSVSDGVALTLSLQVPVGKSTVTLQASVSKSALIGLSTAAAWWGLWSEVQSGYEFFRDNPPSVPARANGAQTDQPVVLAGDPPVPSAQADDTVEYPVDSFVVESRNGKTYFKVKCGEWQTFGVNVWPEVLKRDLPEALKLDPGEYSLAATARVLLKGGKAQKVTAIHVS